MKRIVFALTTAAALLSAPALQAGTRLSGEEKLAKLLEGRVAGEPVDCINTYNTRSARIIDKTAIVYEQGSTIYVNRTTNPRTLDDGDVMVTKLHSSRLCNVDTVHLRDQSHFMPSGFVGLDTFVPYRKATQAH